MIVEVILFFVFVQFSLLVPGYGYAKASGWFTQRPYLNLLFGYLGALAFLGLLALAGYALKIPPPLLTLSGWLVLLGGVFLFVRLRAHQDFKKFRYPLLCFLLMSIFSCAFISLRYPTGYQFLPDPKPQAGRNYQVLNVKVLNVSKTIANDNYVPYRQAQFFINRMDPGQDDFIDAWGVHFFQRTPLMGSVTAGYYLLLNEKPPTNFTWDIRGVDPANTYLEFQVLAQILNTLFIIPAFFLLTRLFSRRVAMIASLFLVTSPFFLYNTVFTWPKSLVAFFVLTMWLLLFENRLRFTVLAGAAGGLAYLTHDLAAFYIVASIGLLLYKKRFRDCLIISGIWLVFAIPWILLSSVVYNKPSSFMLYPFSLHGLPDASKQSQIISEFLHTSPFELISIRGDTLFYLISPYDLIYSGGGQSWFIRLWAVEIFSIPGSVGIGLLIPVLLGAWKRIQKLDFWILVLVPIILATAIVGWRGSRAIASLHFAQAIVVLLTGLAIAYLSSLKHRGWLWLVFGLQIFALCFNVLYSYDFSEFSWLIEPGNGVAIALMIGIMSYCGYLLFRILGAGPPRWLNSSEQF